MSDNVVVIGTQWGDEGKGKIVDLLTEKAEVIVRFQGGNNAGHTLVTGDRKIVLHLIPSGILHLGKLCLIGNGVVLDPEVFCEELDRLQRTQVDAGPEQLKVSHKTHLILPYHKQLDGLRERMKSGKDRIGTTGRGIGPAYEDKASRVGIRACDILDEELLFQKISRALEEKNVLFKHRYEVEPCKPGEVLEAILPATRRLQSYLTDVSAEIARARERGQSILFEGAQGIHLDIDHGTYPFVTSSNTVASNAATGSGCGLSAVDRVTAVVKAYTTRVGAGPFPTELEDERGDLLQRQGAEFGATTGRKRRCGWLDLVILRESARLSGPSEIALTKLDVLSGLKEISVCTKYLLDNEVCEYPPQMENGLALVTPVYESLPGWSEDISGARSWDDLPRAAQEYVRFLEQELKVRVGIISVGPDRSQTLIRSAPAAA